MIEYDATRTFHVPVTVTLSQAASALAYSHGQSAVRLIRELGREEAKALLLESLAAYGTYAEVLDESGEYDGVHNAALGKLREVFPEWGIE